jgi:hypothetical protein
MSRCISLHIAVRKRPPSDNQMEVIQHKNKLVTFVQLTWCKRVQWLNRRHLFIELYKYDESRHSEN